ncbi:MAG: VCBS repeat-containing protein [Planctomycetota bacterium]
MLAPLLVTLVPFVPPQSGTFGPERFVTWSAPSPRAVAVLDVEGDGDRDVVVAASRAGAVYWFENAGGTIERRGTLAEGLDGIRSVTAGDIDTDGDDDLVVVSDSGFLVHRIENLGDGVFGPPVELETFGRVGRRVEIADIDDDGDLDVIVPGREDESDNAFALFLFENLPGGAFFSDQRPLGTGDAPAHAVVADLDGDGTPDLASAGPFRHLGWFRDDGTQPWTFVQVDEFTSAEPAQIAAADLDGDGDLELVGAVDGARSVVVYENLGAGAYGPRIELDVGSFEAPEISVLDLDLDGDLDIAAGREDAAAPVWLENASGLQFVLRDELTSADLDGIERQEFADIDGDSLPDLVMASRDGNVAWARSVPPVGAGAAFEATARPITRWLDEPVAVAAVDLDGDGDRDVVGASIVDPIGIVRSLQLAPGVYSAIEPISAAVGSTASALAVGDLDGDGDEDVAARDSTGRILALENDGSGDLVGPLVIGDLPPSSGGVFDLLDVDGDGDLDVVTDDSANVSLVVFDQLGGGTFAPPRTLASGVGRFTEIAFGQLGGDQEPDFAATVTSGVTTAVRWFLGDGTGVFVDQGVVAETPGLGLATTRPQRLVWLDGDQVLTSLWSQANGFRAPSVLRQLQGQGQYLAIVEDRDLAVASRRIEGGQRIEFLRDSVSFSEVVAEVPALTALETWDLDGDGDRDLLTASRVGDSIATFDNTRLTGPGVEYCEPAVANAAGRDGRLFATGSRSIALGGLELVAYDLPPGTTTLFLASRTSAFTPGPGGSLGTLCLGSPIGRFLGPGQAGPANSTGNRRLEVDPSQLPQPNGFVSAVSGESWQFQAWYRDSAGGAATSNFTTALLIIFF